MASTIRSKLNSSKPSSSRKKSSVRSVSVFGLTWPKELVYGQLFFMSDDSDAKNGGAIDVAFKPDILTTNSFDPAIKKWDSKAIKAKLFTQSVAMLNSRHGGAIAFGVSELQESNKFRGRVYGVSMQNAESTLSTWRTYVEEVLAALDLSGPGNEKPTKLDELYEIKVINVVNPANKSSSNAANPAPEGPGAVIAVVFKPIEFASADDFFFWGVAINNHLEIFVKREGPGYETYIAEGPLNVQRALELIRERQSELPGGDADSVAGGCICCGCGGDHASLYAIPYFANQPKDEMPQLVQDSVSKKFDSPAVVSTETESKE